MIRSLSDIESLLTAAGEPTGIAVVMAADQAALASLRELTEAGYIRPLLIDTADNLAELAAEHLPADSYEVFSADDDAAAAALGVSLVREGKAGALMKGHISSGRFLKAVVDRDHGIRRSKVLSHVAVLEAPRLPRPIIITDGGMITVPDQEQTEAIIDHGVQVLTTLGESKAKVALLSAAESVIPRLPSAELQVEVARDYAKGSSPCANPAVDRSQVIVEGPLSLDISLVEGIGEEKGYEGQIKGDANIIVAPEIVVGNSLSKSLIYFGGGQMAGVVLGAACPIILVSRSADAKEKKYSIALAIAMGSGVAETHKEGCDE